MGPNVPVGNESNEVYIFSSLKRKRQCGSVIRGLPT